MTTNEILRQLPSVHALQERLEDLSGEYPNELIVSEIRAAVARARSRLVASPDAEPEDVEADVRGELARLRQPSLRPVINATGVVLHTNLGRAPLGPVEHVTGYSNLEYDLRKGVRGKRDVHIAGLLEKLLGTPGIAVNNNAAAVYLTLNELAGGGEVIVSRGELIEIGEGFRIPDIMERSGAILREIGTTNKTNIEDYRRAINENTGLILVVHRSNFRVVGFTSQPALADIAGLGRERGIPVYEDLGSGCVADLRRFGITEPTPRESLRAGVDVISFSGDKLLGGPQAGIIAGKGELVRRIRKNPMFRALRLDKLIYRALEETLRNLLLERYDAIPALRMIAEPASRIRERAENLLASVPGVPADLVEGESVIGGGSTPAQSIPTCLISVAAETPAALEKTLREGDPPVITRVENERVLLDLRTVFPDDETALGQALASALQSGE